MNRMIPMLLAAALCAWAPEARADAFGYRLSRTVGGTGVAAAGVGPVVTLAGAMTVANRVDPETGTFEGGGIPAGAGVMVVGVGITALAPAVVVGSSLGGNLSLRDLDQRVPFTAGIVGFAGVGVQVAGWVASVQGVSNGGDGQGGAALRLVGWSTGLIGGGVQLLNNGRGYRNALEQAAVAPRERVQLALVPRLDGAALVGTF